MSTKSPFNPALPISPADIQSPDDKGRFLVPMPAIRDKFTGTAPKVPAKSRRPSRALLPNGLTKRQELWAQHFAEHGDAIAAAIAAGYSPTRADNRASENRYSPVILARVRELVQLRQSAGAPTAVGYIEEIAAGEFTDARKAAVRLKAATVMAHTAGVGPVVRTQSETKATVEHTLSQSALELAWGRLAAVAGYDLGAPPMIDAVPA